MNNYKLDISKEEWVEAYTQEWILEWCAENHPEIFNKARECLSEIYDEKECILDKPSIAHE